MRETRIAQARPVHLGIIQNVSSKLNIKQPTAWNSGCASRNIGAHQRRSNGEHQVKSKITVRSYKKVYQAQATASFFLMDPSNFDLTALLAKTMCT